MDAGIATEDNVAWLRDNGYRYLVVSRQRTRHFDPERSICHRDPVAPQGFTCTRWWMRTEGEVRLYCYSEERAKKEEGHRQTLRRSASRGELRKLHEGLSRPRTRKGLRLMSGSASGGSRSAAAAPGSITQVDVVARPAQRQGSGRHLGEHKPLARAPCSPTPVSTVCAPMSSDWDPADLVAHLHHAHRSRSRVPLSQVRTRPPPHLPPKPRTVPTVTSSSPSSPTNWSRPSAGASPNTERTASWTTLASYPPRPAPCHRHPSAERTAEPSTSARPPVPSNSSTQNLRRSRSPSRTPGGVTKVDRLNS